MSRRARRRRESSISANMLSFSKKRISRHALFTFLLGILLLLGFLALILAGVISKGHIGTMGGAMGCIFMVLAFFGVLWGLASYDEAKTSQSFKIPGICLNIVVIFLGITFIML